jgi:hypothetical protein
MSETYRPVEPKISGRHRLPRPAMATILFAGLLIVMVIISAAVQLDRSSREPSAAAGASAAPSAAASAADPSSKPKADRQGRGNARAWRTIHITSISGDQVALATDDGWRRTITVTSATTVTKGDKTIAAGDLAVGDQVRIQQRRNDDGTYTVTAIHVVLPMTGGRVTAISAGSITVERRGGATQVIATTSATDYKVGEADGARSDVVVGARITAVGEESGSTFTASTVWVQPARVGGTVTKVTSSAITIERRDGKAVVVHVDGDTKVRVRGKGEAKVGDIKVGDRLEARGQLRADGSLDANRVQARTPRAKAKPTPTAAP